MKVSPPLAALFLVLWILAENNGFEESVEFVPAENKIDVTVGGKHFTTYLYGGNLTKPILYPLRSPSGIAVNRAYPLEREEGESEDHPHHVGLFFTYDRVNGEGFWNNTGSPPQIRHIQVTKMNGGTGQGKLSTILHWVGKSGHVLLEEKRDMAVTTAREARILDFHILLSAREKRVIFEDTKEGMFGIRVAHWLKEEGGSGKYLSSNGGETEKNVWGTRAKWVRLEGRKDGKVVGIAILNHPSSVNYPTFWHARAYGLFAANPLGQFAFQNARKEEDPKPFQLTLEPGRGALFKFLVIIYEGQKTKDQVEGWFQDYVKSKEHTDPEKCNDP